MLLEGYHVPAFSTTNVDLPTLDVLAELLFAERAPLYKKLVITEQKVESLSGSTDAARRSRTCSRCSRASRSRTTSATSRRRSTTRWPASPARASTTRRCAEVLSHVKYAFAGQLSTADKTAYTASSFIALTGDLASINAYFALYDKVTSADVKRVAAELLHAGEPHRRHA